MKLSEFKRYIDSLEKGLIPDLEIVVFEEKNTHRVYKNLKLFGMTPNGLELYFNDEV